MCVFVIKCYYYLKNTINCHPICIFNAFIEVHFHYRLYTRVHTNFLQPLQSSLSIMPPSPTKPTDVATTASAVDVSPNVYQSTQAFRTLLKALGHACFTIHPQTGHVRTTTADALRWLLNLALIVTCTAYSLIRPHPHVGKTSTIPSGFRFNQIALSCICLAALAASFAGRRRNARLLGALHACDAQFRRCGGHLPHRRHRRAQLGVAVALLAYVTSVSAVLGAVHLIVDTMPMANVVLSMCWQAYLNLQLEAVLLQYVFVLLAVERRFDKVRSSVRI